MVREVSRETGVDREVSRSTDAHLRGHPLLCVALLSLQVSLLLSRVGHSLGQQVSTERKREEREVNTITSHLRHAHFHSLIIEDLNIVH